MSIEIPKVFLTFLSAVGTKRFIRVARHEKHPIDKNWQSPGSLRFPHDSELKEHIKQGGNYGIVGGRGLIIIDVDDPEFYEELSPVLPPTLEVTSPGSNLPHLYYASDLDSPIRLRDKNGENLGDIQGAGKQVLGPGSIHPNRKKYTITKTQELTYLSQEELQKRLGPWIISKKTINAINEAGHQEYERVKIDMNQLIKSYNLQLTTQGNELYGSHPIHGSSGGKNFWINLDLNVWHCFRCNSGGGPLSLFAVLENIISCENAQPGALTGLLFWEILELAASKGILSQEQLKILQEKTTREGIEPAQFFTKKEGKIIAFVPKRLADFIEQEKEHLFFATSPKSPLYHYNKIKGIWEPNGEETIHTLATYYLYNLEKKSYVDETLFLIRARNYIPWDQIDNDRKKLVLKNGVLNLENHELEPFNPKIYALNALPIQFNNQAECPRVKQFLTEVTEDIDTLIEWIGYHLLKAYPYHKALMLIGDGSNGKSTFLALLQAFLGKDNVTSIALHQLVVNRFAAASLYGKLANLSPDLSPDELKRTGTFKAATGGDRLYAEQKHRDPFYFTNYAKLTFAANTLPPTPDQSHAFFRRWLLINFPHTFEGNKCDPNLLSKLVSEEELSGLLNLALEGLTRLINTCGFTKSCTTEELQEEYEFLSDPVKAFIDECLKLDPNAIISKDALYNSYYAFCKERGFSSVTKRTLTAELKPRIPQLMESRERINGERVRCWKGISLQPDGIRKNDARCGVGPLGPIGPGSPYLRIREKTIDSEVEPNSDNVDQQPKRDKMEEQGDSNFLKEPRPDTVEFFRKSRERQENKEEGDK